MVSARAVALRALVAVETDERVRLREALQVPELAPRDQAFAFELAHGVMRRQRCLDHVVHGLARRGVPPDPRLLTVLRLGIYQLLFVPGMPMHAAVHETVELARHNRGFVNALLRQVAKSIVDRPMFDPVHELALGPERTLRLARPLPADEVERLAIVHSLPDFLMARWRVSWDLPTLRQIAAAASATPEVFLRPAGARDAAALQNELAAEGVQTELAGSATSPAAPQSPRQLLRWSGGSSPFATAAFRSGHFVVQDPTACLAADAVPCRPGDTVVDLCAAPGTKTTALAERVRPGGRVFAFDIDRDRLLRVRDNVARLGLQDVVSIVASAADLPRADAVLVDVPCSNTGVLSRRVEVRRRLQPSTFAELAALQRQLLSQAIGSCKPGGAVVYSTCSIDEEENGGVVRTVLADSTTPSCEVVRSVCTLPASGTGDGGYFAVLRRSGESVRQ